VQARTRRGDAASDGQNSGRVFCTPYDAQVDARAVDARSDRPVSMGIGLCADEMFCAGPGLAVCDESR
jgi:hypothetical protein